jgi:hypothetical protein
MILSNEVTGEADFGASLPGDDGWTLNDVMVDADQVDLMLMFVKHGLLQASPI